MEISSTHSTMHWPLNLFSSKLWGMENKSKSDNCTDLSWLHISCFYDWTVNLYYGSDTFSSSIQICAKNAWYPWKCFVALPKGQHWYCCNSQIQSIKANTILQVMHVEMFEPRLNATSFRRFVVGVASDLSGHICMTGTLKLIVLHNKFCHFIIFPLLSCLYHERMDDEIKGLPLCLFEESIKVLWLQRLSYFEYWVDSLCCPCVRLPLWSALYSVTWLPSEKEIRFLFSPEQSKKPRMPLER